MCYGANAKTTEKLKRKEWDALLAYLEQTKNITEFWMPVNRFDNNDYHPFVWRLPGRRWGTPFTKKYHLINETNFGENCVKVVSKNGSITYEVTHCDNRLYNLCIYKEKFVVKSTCKDNFAAIRYRPNVCYGLNKDTKIMDISLSQYMENAATIKRILHFMDVEGEFGLVEAEAAHKGYQLVVNERGLFGLSIRTGNYGKLISRIVFLCGSGVIMKL